VIFIGLDDTDNHESCGTGRLARSIAQELSADTIVVGVTRHQLLVDPRVPYTSHNSSAAIGLQDGRENRLEELFQRVRALMLADFVSGSDPGLCVAPLEKAQMLTEFGRRAQSELVTQDEARALAGAQDVLLAGLGGTQDGVIGALAAVGLAASGQDGRYLWVGQTRQMSGLCPISEILEAGVSSICTLDGSPVEQGLVLADKLRPARRDGLPVLYVEWEVDHWMPVKLG
jgi:tRNA(Ile2) C34 agmatinyltransferase TiaS